ncbi:hypothetical protein ADL22_03550 [Streptomyces sp. NRRL F-4489]|uniref:DUF1963 domain-containing protein n=1 Tax=Streptomyces sp. NRRL F-4489 TaxID=1609095 RepID=UPI00074ABE57|nr:hypothetical protein [Streptomyces sp. NRRL F-4489]KUL53764.1 hypothetical protein ADL22_03550 [Streptomyces sp. NRRL F-4489]
MPEATPEPPAKDLRTLIPEYAALAREATLLNPEPGDPGARESSLGGKPLWPADEPWPYCAREDHWTDGPDARDHTPVVPGAVPMVPILQLFARDVPALEFPEGKDVFQLVWCALTHEQDPRALVMPRLYWRNEAEVLAGGLLSEIPEASEGEYDEDNMPEPSTVSPTTAKDYPRSLDLPKDMGRTWERHLRSPADRSTWPPDNNIIGTKAGGWPAWTQPADWPDCERGHRMEHLLTITGDIHLADCGGVYFFHCRRCPALPWDWRFDCH